VVLRATCVYWPKITSSSDRTNPEGHRHRLSLSPVLEDADSDQESNTSSDTIIHSDTTANSLDSNATLQEQADVLHLPIVHLPLPSPETFPLLLIALHTPARPLAPRLLGLSSKFSSRADILAELERCSMPDLMAKLGHIHGVWKNVCVLSISDARIWGGMAMAWSCVISVMAGIGGGWACAEEMSGKGG
jgi:hypothetical protein